MSLLSVVLFMALRSTGNQGCGMDLHRHALVTSDNGSFIVDHQNGEPDIVFDGECHDEQENVCREENGEMICHGSKLPKPCPMGKARTGSGGCEIPKSSAPEDGQAKPA